MMIKQVIANLINETRDNGVYGSVHWSEVKEVVVRPGMAEIEVRTRAIASDAEWHTIPAAPVFTEVLTQALNW